MTGPTAPRPRPRLRALFGAAFLASIAVLAASCVDALDLSGYDDSFAKTCELVTRCYGDGFAGCSDRVARVEAQGAEEEWLAQVNGTGCLADCAALYKCLDFPPICTTHGESGSASTGTGEETGTGSEGEGTKGEVTAECALDEDCCGFGDGSKACEDGQCCAPLGAGCAIDTDCCPNIGVCDPITETCGGVTCEIAGNVCLNDFQCCSGQCGDDGRCSETPCPPVGFVCETDEDCCKLACDPDTKRCYDPVCSLQGEPCTTAADCCDPTFLCHTNGGVGGVCNSAECSPDNVDCLFDDQCCSTHCIEGYRLCGQCSEIGGECSAGAACCKGAVCGDSGKCIACSPLGESCANGAPCCFGLACRPVDQTCVDPSSL